MVVITMESESCSWVALGNTEEEAREALRERWNKRQRHLKQNGTINQEWIVGNVSKLEEEYGFKTYNIEPGQCLMDWEI